MKRFAEQRPYIGRRDQLFEVKEYRLCGGKADGLHAVDVDNGSGLCVTVLADRCMDVGRVTFRGQSAAYLSPAGYVAPVYEQNWLRAYGGGLMTTCGLENIGVGAPDGGEPLPMHGGLSLTPAQDFAVTVDDSGDRPEAVISGSMRQASLFGGALTLTRTIRIAYGDNTLRVCDRIRNDGFVPLPLMLLYHINLGYPLIDEDTVLHIPSDAVVPRDEPAAVGVHEWHRLQPPTAGYREQCFYHRFDAPFGTPHVCEVYQPKSGTHLHLTWQSDTLDRMVQWKMMGEGDYVLGLEPANATLGGRAAARADGSLKTLSPGESAYAALTFAFTTDT